MSGIDGLGKTIGDAATTIGSVLGDNKADSAPKARGRRAKGGAQGGAKGGGSMFSTLTSFLPAPIGGIASFVGGLLGSK
jgi:hypothetical protein